MNIDEALAGIQLAERVNANLEVTGIQYDSRRVQPGNIFVAMQGGSADGNRFITAARERGAGAILTDSREAWNARPSSGTPFYLVEHGRRALAGIAANLLDHPERKLTTSAVTGTNGKTTTAWLLEQMLQSAGCKCVLVGTIETHVGEQVRVSEHTTPEASDLLRTFADGVSVGCTEAVMEMSSHALDQERVWGVPVDVALFTNLTQDHLDYHGTMEAYAAAKAKLFRGVGAAPPTFAIINADTPFSRRMIAAAVDCACTWTYSIQNDDVLSRKADFIARDLVLGAGQSQFLLDTPQGTTEIVTPLTGRVNVYNAIAAIAASMARAVPLQQAAVAARNWHQVPGRFQSVPNQLGFTVVVDYAHTDDALRNLIALARELVGSGRVITLFGCGGDRDRTKRPKMGRAAGEGSDLVVLTNDNSRTEDPQVIFHEVLSGVRETGTNYIVEQDRATAIRVALSHASPGDIVLLAGKGHEKVQILGERTIPFDDVQVAAAILKEMR